MSVNDTAGVPELGKVEWRAAVDQLLAALQQQIERLESRVAELEEEIGNGLIPSIF